MKFYRNIFAIACFAFFLSAITTNSAVGFLIAMVCGMLSRTAEKKGWPDPFSALPSKPTVKTKKP